MSSRAPSAPTTRRTPPVGRPAKKVGVRAVAAPAAGAPLTSGYAEPQPGDGPRTDARDRRRLEQSLRQATPIPAAARKRGPAPR